MADRASATLAFWSEHRQQFRQSETQRSVITNYVLVLVSALTALIVQQEFAPRTLPLAAFIVLLGLYGALSAAKYHERAEYHLEQARALTGILHELGALGDDQPLQDRRSAHYAKYPRLHRLRLHWLWTGLHLALTTYGAAVSIVLIVRALQ